MDLTFDKAMKIAQAMGLAERDAKASWHAYTLQPVMGPDTKPMQIWVTVEEHDLFMEVDTGALVKVVSKTKCNHVCSARSAPQLQP